MCGSLCARGPCQPYVCQVVILQKVLCDHQPACSLLQSYTHGTPVSLLGVLQERGDGLYRMWFYSLELWHNVIAVAAAAAAAAAAAVVVVVVCCRCLVVVLGSSPCSPHWPVVQWTSA